MPLDAWLLLLVAVGLGLGLEVAFYRARRGSGGPHGDGRDAAADPDRGGDRA